MTTYPSSIASTHESPMTVVTGHQQFPQNLRGGIMTMGNFDGVHRGHQHILGKVCSAAQHANVPSIVYTFDPHPASVLAPEVELPMLQTITQRLQHVATQGMMCTVVEPFTQHFATQGAEDFFQSVIATHLAPSALIVGYDLTFGKQRSGTIDRLRQWSADANIDCTVIEPFYVDQVLVSSTYVRSCVRQGKFTAATDALGTPYAIVGEVVRGHGIGKQLGFPTLNMVAANDMIPQPAIYITTTYLGIDPTPWPAATYIGRRPTFGGETLVIESYILEGTPPEDCSNMQVAFHKRIRGDMQFPTPDALKVQIAADVDQAREFHGLST